MSITLTIDGKKIVAEEGMTILNVASQNGIKIPNLCYDGRGELYGACGLCTVEVEGIPKLLRACSTKVSDGMVAYTQTERVKASRKVALELLLSDHTGDCVAPCSKACPAGTDCQGYVGLIANGEYKEAVKLIKEKLPLPASIGRICPHPCEKQCRRQYVDEPISIAFLKSFVADMDLLGDTYTPTIEPDTNKKVAIIGGGPAGLTSAYFLRKQGHSVTVFEQMPQMGGMLRYGIPEYRLPKAVLDKEVKLIEDMGVELKNNVNIGKDISFDQIKEDNDATLVAIGAWNSSKMRVQGEDLQGVWGGIDFLREVALGNKPEIGKNVAVCGGGNLILDWILYFIVYNFIIGHELIYINFFHNSFCFTPHILSFLIVFPITLITGFWLNKHITFTQSSLQGYKQLYRYILVVIANILINYFGLKLCVDIFGLYPTPSKMIITIITVVISFFC